ncbi:FCD domain protein, partial [Leifsonia aquatica ATCC 14665]
ALRRALDARSRLDRGLEAHVDADTAFHRAIVAAAHNDILAELFDGFVPRLRQSMVEMLRLRPLSDEGADHDAHRALLDAIADRDAVAASRLSRDHLTSMKERLS